MMSVNQSVQETPIVSHDRVRETIRQALHVAISVERRFTAEQLAEQSGVSLSAIRSYMRNDATKEPGLARALSLAVIIGPKAVNSILALIGYSGAAMDEPDAIRPMRIVSQAIGHLSVISKAAEDDFIDHQEEPGTTEAADLLIATVLPLSSAGKAS